MFWKLKPQYVESLTFIRALKITRQMATDLIWNWQSFRTNFAFCILEVAAELKMCIEGLLTLVTVL
jgi:hypothetical protein